MCEGFCFRQKPNKFSTKHQQLVVTSPSKGITITQIWRQITNTYIKERQNTL